MAEAIVKTNHNHQFCSLNIATNGEIPIFLSGLGSSVKNHTIAATLISAVLVALFMWWFQSGPVMFTLYILLSVIAIASVPIVYRLAGYTEADEVEWLEDREVEDHRELIERLRKTRIQLNDLGVQEGVRQADMLTGILDDYHSVVETRFLGKKHSPLAYLAAARRLQKHAVQNLTDVVATGHSMSTISRNASDGDEGERADHQAGLYGEQERRMDELLEENRKLFDALTETAVEVANIKSFSRYDRIDTLGRLVSLAEIANKTGK